MNVDGSTNAKQSRDVLVRTLSIKNNITGVTNKVLEMPFRQSCLESTPSPLDDSLLTRCMESLDPSRADDYHDWIKIGCVLYTIDKENGYRRWSDFSKQSYKFDEDYLCRVYGLSLETITTRLVHWSSLQGKTTRALTLRGQRSTQGESF